MEHKIDERLQKAAEEYIELPDSCLEYSDDGWEDKTDCDYVEKAFIAGAKWQKEQLMSKAVNGVEINSRRSDGRCILSGNFSKFDTGDKVKLIIIKQE